MDLTFVDPTTEMRESIDRMLFGVNTCIPGIIDSFDAATQTVAVRPAVQMKVTIDGVQSFKDLPEIINAPLVFPFAITAGFALTLPVRKNDACIILFSQRSIDNWHDKGGVQPPEDGTSTRHHDLTDAFVMLAAPPSPDVLGAWEANGIELRNRVRNSRVTVLDTSVEIVKGTTSIVVTDAAVDITTTDATVKADTLTVDSPLSTFKGIVNIEGVVNMLGNAEVTGTLKNNTKDVGSTHTHPQGSDSNGDAQQNTGVPV